MECANSSRSISRFFLRSIEKSAIYCREIREKSGIGCCFVLIFSRASNNQSERMQGSIQTVTLNLPCKNTWWHLDVHPTLAEDPPEMKYWQITLLSNNSPSNDLKHFLNLTLKPNKIIKKLLCFYTLKKKWDKETTKEWLKILIPLYQQSWNIPVKYVSLLHRGRQNYLWK